MSPAKSKAHDKFHLGTNAIVADHSSIDFEFMQELAMMTTRIPMLMFCDVQPAVETKRTVQQQAPEKARRADIAAGHQRFAKAHTVRRSCSPEFAMHA